MSKPPASRVSRCISALRREWSFDRDPIDDAPVQPFGDFQLS